MMFMAIKNKKVAAALIALSLILIAFGLIWQFWYLPYTYNKIQSFDDCAKKYPILLSYPGQCNTPDGRHFVQNID